MNKAARELNWTKDNHTWEQHADGGIAIHGINYSVTLTPRELQEMLSSTKGGLGLMMEVISQSEFGANGNQEGRQYTTMGMSWGSSR